MKRRHPFQLANQPAFWMMVLGAVALVLCGLVVQVLFFGAEREPQIASADSRAGAPSVPRLRDSLGDSEAYDSIANQNLFSQRRQPFPVPTEPPQPSAATPTPKPDPTLEEIKDYSFEISGYLSFGTRFKRAFLSAQTGGEQQQDGFGVGDKVGEYTLEKIRGNEVFLARGEDDVVKLTFERFGEGGAFESSYQELLQDYQVEDGEQIFQRNVGGEKQIFRKEMVSGAEVALPIQMRPEVLREKIETGEKTVVISGVVSRQVPTGLIFQTGTDEERREILRRTVVSGSVDAIMENINRGQQGGPIEISGVVINRGDDGNPPAEVSGATSNNGGNNEDGNEQPQQPVISGR